MANTVLANEACTVHAATKGTTMKTKTAVRGGAATAVAVADTRAVRAGLTLGRCKGTIEVQTVAVVSDPVIAANVLAV